MARDERNEMTTAEMQVIEPTSTAPYRLRILFGDFPNHTPVVEFVYAFSADRFEAILCEATPENPRGRFVRKELTEMRGGSFDRETAIEIAENVVAEERAFAEANAEWAKRNPEEVA